MSTAEHALRLRAAVGPQNQQDLLYTYLSNLVFILEETLQKQVDCLYWAALLDTLCTLQESSELI